MNTFVIRIEAKPPVRDGVWHRRCLTPTDMIILMGVMGGFCVLAMVLPVFQMTQMVH